MGIGRGLRKAFTGLFWWPLLIGRKQWINRLHARDMDIAQGTEAAQIVQDMQVPQIAAATENVEYWETCCAVWSSYQNKCLETMDVNDEHCPNPWNEAPVGDNACPKDCAVWHIQRKYCYEPAAGYPGDYVNEAGVIVHGGDMTKGAGSQQAENGTETEA